MSPFNRILLCYDATPEGQLALRFGAALAQQLQAETHLLSIFDYTYLSSGFDVLSSMKFEVDEQAAQETLREGIDCLRAWGVTATGHYSVGNAIDQISRLAESLKVDLIVIGHHPHGFFARWWSGENHALLLDRVSCGVLFKVDARQSA
ncbi:universal stress protein UspA [Paraburkholderia ginsengiterrae]|uniref:Universal stress protein UspA n=2 Tax=Paraburkholderia ginsengiterrae TaxID=1462993 RepID=A0A1A9MY97_9BURK|nr:universal stress protein UspA [Paraburkholderia ginsengiterrae]OAJ54107.1 universal stress protein UspA [Paraburkholderia ginsengiterrae]